MVQSANVYTIPSLALPASGTVRTRAFPVRGKRLSLWLAWTGTPTGSFSLQASFDGGVTWSTVPGAATEFSIQPSGAAGGIVCNWENVPGALWSILYTATSGTGTLNATAAQV